MIIYVYDLNEEQINTLDVDYKLTRSLTGLSTFEFTSHVPLEKGYRIVFQKDKKLYEFILVDIEYSRKDSYEFEYYCQDSIIEIASNVIEEERPTLNINKTLDIVFKDSRWSYDVKGYDEGVKRKCNFYRINMLEAFNIVVENFKVEWHTRITMVGSKITKREVIIEKIGGEANSRLEFGKNIIEFKRKISSEPIITALIGLGKGEEKFDEEGESTGGFGRRITFADVNNGVWYVANEEAKELYGLGEKGSKKHVFGFVEFPEITSKLELLEATKKELEQTSQRNIEYTISVENLHLDCGLGDMVQAIDEVIDFRGYLRVIQVEETNDLIILTFGSKTQTISKFTNNTRREFEEKVTEHVGSILNETLKKITHDYLNEDGYTYNLEANNEYKLPAGIYSFDKPINENPTKVVYLGAGKVLISNEKGTDGAWKWQTAMDGRGVAGESIITNSITANKLAPDVGQSLDLSSNVSITQMVKKDFVTKEEHKSSMKERDEVNAQKVSVDDYNQNNEIINQRMTYLEQTESSFELLFSSLKENIENNRVNIEELSAKIVSGMDEKGHTYTEWGSSDQLNKVRVGSDGISMISNEQKTMKLRDGVVEANSLYVTKTIGFGNHVAERYNEEFTLFRWTGGVL